MVVFIHRRTEKPWEDTRNSNPKKEREKIAQRIMITGLIYARGPSFVKINGKEKKKKKKKRSLFLSPFFISSAVFGCAVIDENLFFFYSNFVNVFSFSFVFFFTFPKIIFNCCIPNEVELWFCRKFL